MLGPPTHCRILSASVLRPRLRPCTCLAPTRQLVPGFSEIRPFCTALHASGIDTGRRIDFQPHVDPEIRPDIGQRTKISCFGPAQLSGLMEHPDEEDASADCGSEAMNDATCNHARPSHRNPIRRPLHSQRPESKELPIGRPDGSRLQQMSKRNRSMRKKCTYFHHRQSGFGKSAPLDSLPSRPVIILGETAKPRNREPANPRTRNTAPCHLSRRFVPATEKTPRGVAQPG